MGDPTGDRRGGHRGVDLGLAGVLAEAVQEGGPAAVGREDGQEAANPALDG